MTREEILAMEPGSELNRKVAEEVMGYTIVNDETFGYMERLIDPEDGRPVWNPLEPYSEDIAAAELVVDTMIERGCDDAIYWADFGGGKYAEAEAICKAALCAILEECQTLKVLDDTLKQAPGDEGAKHRGCG